MEDNINEIINLYDEAKDLQEYFKKYPERLAEYKMVHPNTRCDKYEQGFNYDSRFRACESHQVYFSSKKGDYGDSDCYQILHINFSKLFWDYFDEYLNNHKKEIFDYISMRMFEKCKTYKKELQNQIKFLNDVIEKIK